MKRAAVIGLGTVAALGLLALGAAGYLVAPYFLGHPPKLFAQTAAPPAPDYSRPDSWLAWPGRGGAERSTPPGITPIQEDAAIADVFFIHPTTYLGNDVWNVPAGLRGALDQAVLEDQASAFNRCCRIYAPRYRQATLRGLREPGALDLAYGDVARAFRYYIETANRGRPFIIVSHSQGSGHAVRLLQQAVVGTRLQKLLVAAYVIGAYAPDATAPTWLPVCGAPAQTGCVLSWNTNRTGRRGAFRLITDPTYWWNGSWKSSGQAPAICVNPLLWTEQGRAPASLNSGSLPLSPSNGGISGQRSLPKLVANLTGAVCQDHVLDVDPPLLAVGFRDPLSVLFGSYHLFDFNLFWDAIGRNALARVQAWQINSKGIHP